MRIYNIMARLLDYPDSELMQNLPAIMDAVKQDEEISRQERDDLLALVSWMNLHDLTGLQSQYVQTFDMDTSFCSVTNSANGSRMHELEERAGGLSSGDCEIAAAPGPGI